MPDTRDQATPKDPAVIAMSPAERAALERRIEGFLESAIRTPEEVEILRGKLNQWGEALGWRDQPAALPVTAESAASPEAVRAHLAGTEPMSQPSSSDAPRRGLEAIERELATFRERLPEFLKEHEGEVVLIKGDRVLGFFPGWQSAVVSGYKQVGPHPFLVKEVLAVEPVYVVRDYF